MAYRLKSWGLFGFAFLLVGAAPALSQQADGPAKEYALKAAWLTNFIKYLEWPDDWAADQLIIGILGEDPFQDAFIPIQGRAFMGRKLIVRRIPNFENPDELQNCHLLFVTQSQQPHLDQIFEAINGHAVIVVGELDNFAAPGRGDFNFLRSKERVIYELNPFNLESKGLLVTSTLLKYARYLITDEGRRIAPRKMERRR